MMVSGREVVLPMETRLDVRTLAEVVRGLEAEGVVVRTRSEAIRVAVELLRDMLVRKHPGVEVEEPEVALEFLGRAGLYRPTQGGGKRARAARGMHKIVDALGTLDVQKEREAGSKWEALLEEAERSGSGGKNSHQSQDDSPGGPAVEGARSLTDLIGGED